MMISYTRIKSKIFPFSCILFILVFLLFSCQPSIRFRTNDNKNRHFDENDRYSKSYTDLDSFISDWLGTPYKYGGLTKEGIDCSGLAYMLMLHVYKKKIPRTSREQYRKGRKINKFRLLKGDLVFFNIYGNRRVDHVGIYIGDNKFIHASQKNGVIISNLSDSYYKKRYAGSCRY